MRFTASVRDILDFVSRLQELSNCKSLRCLREFVYVLGSNLGSRLYKNEVSVFVFYMSSR